MRKNIMVQILMILLFVIGYTAASAQGDYVITTKGDTLWGKVKYYNNSGIASSNSTYVQLTPEQGKKSTHEILKTLSFRMNNEIYHTVKYEQGYAFMKLVKSGYLSLYSYQVDNQTTWNGFYFAKKDGALLDVPNLGFKKRVSRFLEDCPNVVKDVESGVLGRSDVLKIVDDYNACIELKTNSTLAVKTPATEAWATLANEIKNLPEFDKKSDAMEMVREVQKKLSKSESVPSFLVNGLKDALKDQSSVKDALDTAVQSLN